MAPVRIFQVAYDPSLMRVRAEMLKHAGFDVSSALGNEEAQRLLRDESDYRLIVIGWSGSENVRRKIVRWLKQHLPQCRVIALYSPGGSRISEADFNSCSENPEEWFTAVKRAATAA